MSNKLFKTSHVESLSPHAKWDLVRNTLLVPNKNVLDLFKGPLPQGPPLLVLAAVALEFLEYLGFHLACSVEQGYRWAWGLGREIGELSGWSYRCMSSTPCYQIQPRIPSAMCHSGPQVEVDLIGTSIKKIQTSVRIHGPITSNKYSNFARALPRHVQAIGQVHASLASMCKRHLPLNTHSNGNKAGAENLFSNLLGVRCRGLGHGRPAGKHKSNISILVFNLRIAYLWTFD